MRSSRWTIVSLPLGSPKRIVWKVWGLFVPLEDLIARDMSSTVSGTLWIVLPADRSINADTLSFKFEARASFTSSSVTPLLCNIMYAADIVSIVCCFLVSSFDCTMRVKDVTQSCRELFNMSSNDVSAENADTISC